MHAGEAPKDKEEIVPTEADKIAGKTSKDKIQIKLKQWIFIFVMKYQLLYGNFFFFLRHALMKYVILFLNFVWVIVFTYVILIILCLKMTIYHKSTKFFTQGKIRVIYTWENIQTFDQTTTKSMAPWNALSDAHGLTSIYIFTGW